MGEKRMREVTPNERAVVGHEVVSTHNAAVVVLRRNKTQRLLHQDGTTVQDRREQAIGWQREWNARQTEWQAVYSWSFRCSTARNWCGQEQHSQRQQR